MADGPPSTHSTEINIPVNDDFDELDSAYGDDYASSTASLTDSVRTFREWHGRTFQNFSGSEYWAPNDDKQSEQLDIVHHMLLLLLDGKLFLAPIVPSPQKVLDVGTGTGIWAIDFADQYPSAEVIGTDLSDMMPKFVPPNCRFELDDADLDWTYPPSTFDFIHMRYLMGAIRDWPKLYSEAFKALKPGGWIEHLDLSVVFESDDGTMTEDNILAGWGPRVLESGRLMGKTFEVGKFSKQWITEAGFTEIKERKFKLPMGPWSSDPKMKQIGLWHLFFFLQDLEGICMFLCTKIMKWQHTEVQAYMGKVTAAVKNSNTHTYYRATLVYGKKPDL